ncbi:hypothetical protein DETS111669_32720 [Delftia tsuruhatensis]
MCRHGMLRATHAAPQSGKPVLAGRQLLRALEPSNLPSTRRAQREGVERSAQQRIARDRVQLAIADSDHQNTGLIDHVGRSCHRHGLRASDHGYGHHGPILRERGRIDARAQRVSQGRARIALACRVNAGVVVCVAQDRYVQDLEQRHRRQRGDLLTPRTARRAWRGLLVDRCVRWNHLPLAAHASVGGPHHAPQGPHTFGIFDGHTVARADSRVFARHHGAALVAVGPGVEHQALRDARGLASGQRNWQLHRLLED